MYIVIYQNGNSNKEFFTDMKKHSVCWSFNKADAFLFDSEADARNRMRELIPAYVHNVKVQYMHPLNLPQR